MSPTVVRPTAWLSRLRLVREAIDAHYAPALLIGLSYMAITTLWTLYNAYVPVFLQVDFGLRAAAIGAVMMLDNLLALLVQPWIGARSDRLRSRWGKRLPYIVAATPLAALGFAAIPLAVDAFDGLPGFIAIVMVMLVSMAVMRVPLFALLPDLTRPERRSTANGIINVFGGVGILIATLGLGWLYRIHRAGPFIVGAALLVLTTLVLAAMLPRMTQRYAAPEEEQDRRRARAQLVLDVAAGGGRQLARGSAAAAGDSALHLRHQRHRDLLQPLWPQRAGHQRRPGGDDSGGVFHRLYHRFHPRGPGGGALSAAVRP
jgi:MFS family permease